ncbi:tolloid [Apostichopus japonicus]|uniref:Tolloid n=1 Tax=Stichopus japonicus TaxID=307972 RepID=A0A2G8LK71_STIJA|nr:tolloid [Apostichopus japonicus]
MRLLREFLLGGGSKIHTIYSRVSSWFYSLFLCQHHLLFIQKLGLSDDTTTTNNKEVHGRNSSHSDSLSRDNNQRYREYSVIRHVTKQVQRSPYDDTSSRTSRSRRRRGATAQTGSLWSSGIIAYTIDHKFENTTKDMILQAMRHWEKHTTSCLQFVERDQQEDYAYFTKGIG